MNVSNIIEPHVAEHPETTAILFEENRISYAELDRLINRLAGGLLKLGLKRGDVLSLFLPSLPELIIGYLAAVRAGLTVNVVNAMLREQEVAYILKDCDTRAVLVDTKRLSIIEAIRSEVESLSTVIVLGESEKDEYYTYDSVLDSGKDHFEPVDLQDSDLCHLMYTSGTTGCPRALWPPIGMSGTTPPISGKFTSCQQTRLWWPRLSFIVGDWSTELLGCYPRAEP